MKNWSAYGNTNIKSSMGIGGLMYWMSSSSIWTAATFTRVLPVSNVIDCHHEYLLPFSCKKRNFCPSCHQKRVIEFGEQLHEVVLEKVLHRQWLTVGI